MTQHLTEPQKIAVARAHLAGAGDEVLAHIYNRTPGYIHHLVRADHFKPYLDAAQFRIQHAADEARDLMLYHLPDIAAKLVEDCLAEDPKVRHRAMDLYLKTAIPQRIQHEHHGEVGHRHRMADPDDDTPNPLIEQLQQLSSVLAQAQPDPNLERHLLSGPDARPKPVPTHPATIDLEAAQSEPLPVHGD